jgi:hypothetical protein
MRKSLKKRLTAAATLAGVVGIVGTGLAQSGGIPPWEELEISSHFALAPANANGTVSVDTNAMYASGSLQVAKVNYQTTGEFIGCHVRVTPYDGNLIRCAARDAGGNTLTCAKTVGTDELLSEEGQSWQTMMTAIAAMGETTHLRIQADDVGGDDYECQHIYFANSSADFLASNPGCTEETAVDLGSDGHETTVASDACVRVRDQYPWWWNTKVMLFQNVNGTTEFPIPFEWVNTCSGSSGSGVFTNNWQDKFLNTTNSACPTLIKLNGSGAGTIRLRYWGT